MSHPGPGAGGPTTEELSAVSAAKTIKDRQRRPTPFCISQQLRIFYDRTIYPEIARRTLPLNGTMLYVYATEDPAAFRRLYAAAAKGNVPQWPSVVGTGRTFSVGSEKKQDGFIFRMVMRSADGSPCITWVYRANMRPNADGRYCKLVLQFQGEYGEEAYEDFRANAIRLLDAVEPKREDESGQEAETPPVEALLQ